MRNARRGRLTVGCFPELILPSVGPESGAMRLKVLRLAAACIPLIALFVNPTPAFANTAINLDCGDGSPISGSVDTTTLTEVQGAVQAMIDNPTGASCALSLPSTFDPLATSNDPGSFVVGGGRYSFPGVPCAVNFSLSGHIDQNGLAHGTQTATETNSSTECGGQGHIKANVTCVAVSGKFAEVRGDIMEQSGSLGPDFFPKGTTVWVTDVMDNGRPNTGVPDQIEQFTDYPGTEHNCVAGITYPPAFDVDHGNITVHGG